MYCICMLLFVPERTETAPNRVAFHIGPLEPAPDMAVRTIVPFEPGPRVEHAAVVEQDTLARLERALEDHRTVVCETCEAVQATEE